MKKNINPVIIAEMTILSTFIADCIQSIENLKHKQKQAKTRVEEARKGIIIETDDDIYDYSNNFFDKYYSKYIQGEIIYICRKQLEFYLNNHIFEGSKYNLFKKVFKWSCIFEKKDTYLIESEAIEFIKAHVRSILRRFSSYFRFVRPMVFFIGF